MDLTSKWFAGIVRSPNRFSPFRNWQGAIEERDAVLSRMVLKKQLSQEAADAANAAAALGGTPVLAVRVSSGDERQRHRGVSHHTRAVVELCLAEATVAWPAGLEAPEWLASRRELDVDEWREACEGLPLDHMGRRSDEDPWFFASAFAAGKLARTLIG